MSENNSRIHEAINRLKQVLADTAEKPDRETPGLEFSPKFATPGLTDGMSRQTIKERIVASAVRSRSRGAFPAFLGLSLFFAGLLGVFSAGDYSYNEETGYHDIENDGALERGIGLSMIGLAVILLLSVGYADTRSERELSESVGLMLDMREKFPEIPVDMDINKIKRLQRVLPEIVSHLSPSDKRILDSLVHGDKKILEDEKWRDMAAGIISDHLKSHPKDLEMLVNAYRGVMTFEMANQYTGPLMGGR